LWRVSVSCDEANLVSSAGLLPAAALAQKLGVAELVEARVRLAEHGANGGTKALSVVGAMLAGGDSIDDVALLQAGCHANRLPSGAGLWGRAASTWLSRTRSNRWRARPCWSEPCLTWSGIPL
jgi:hypothetical protein